MFPEPIKTALSVLHNEGFEGYLVGGCVRDLMLLREPKDWDITTNARPDQIEALFTAKGYKSFYENAFGTVTAIIDDIPIEITPYRLEGKYSDRRHPDDIAWAKTLEEDLSRRDFTVNAMAMDKEDMDAVVDLFGGKEDLKNKLMRTVGDANARFNEDALRLLRAVRLAHDLRFTIEEATYQAIKENAKLLELIATERIRDELIKMLSAHEPEKGVKMLQETGLLHYILPEIEEGIGVVQRGPHRFDVFTHNLYSLKWAAKESDDWVVRLAAWLHDVGKPRVRQEQDGKFTFYDHQVVGAKMAEVALTRLHFSNKVIEEIAHLIYHHMFYYDVGKVTPSGVRRLLQRVGGKEVFDRLLVVRRADRQATPVPKSHPYRLRHLQYMVEKVAHDPLSRFQLVITGDDLKQELGVPEGIRIGLLLQGLLVQVLEDPGKNTREFLLEEARRLNKKTDGELKVYTKAMNEKKREREEILKGKYYVR